ncbi:MAG TPA: glycoside hydrolase family protein [Myxococcales bacterium]|nr:glycoside hydrolase family protein [Myxococcales bacterium]
MPSKLSLSDRGLDFLYRREALPGVSNRLHWPGGASGVTLGPGYDMKVRTKAEVEADLKAIGVPDGTASKAAGGAGKSGTGAKAFAAANKGLVALTSDQEKRLLKHVVPLYENAVRNAVTVKVTQHQFDAMVSLAYNIGPGAFRRSSVVARLNAGKPDEAAEKFKLWSKSGGKVNQGLVNRRNLEVELFKS